MEDRKPIGFSDLQATDSAPVRQTHVGMAPQRINPVDRARSPATITWGNYADAVSAVDRIVPYKTTRVQLQAEKIDPAVNPSITILSYTDVLQRFNAVAAVPPDYLERGIADCLKAGKRCTAYSISVSQVTTHRVGNFWQFWLDMLNFRRRTVTTGWSFNALIIFVDDLAVFALAGGQPNINTEQFTRNPLGPLQGIGEALRPRIP